MLHKLLLQYQSRYATIELPKGRMENGKMKDLKFRNKLAQENFDYYVWNCRHISEVDLTKRLYDKGFTKSEARQAIAFIYNKTIKAYNAR